MSNFQKPDIQVRLKRTPSMVGITTGNIQTSSNGRVYVEVNMIGEGISRYPPNQLEEIKKESSPLEDLKDGRFADPDVLRTILIHVQLSGRLSDFIYSMETTNTDFYAHQFKPVLKILNNPSNSILIADEVGLGKTIEAGLIWTELKARYSSKNLIVLCPFNLRKKWRDELQNKFGVDAKIANAEELLEAINNQNSRPRGSAFICGIQSIRPDRDWDDPEHETKRIKQRDLALKVEELGLTDNKIFDLLIIDEAHHLRNPSTQLNRIGTLFREISEHAVFLTATPINLKDRDLFSQLSILDSGMFTNLDDFQNTIEANKPIVEAKELMLRSKVTSDVIEKTKSCLKDALSSSLLSGSKTIQSIYEMIKNESSLDKKTSTEIAAKLDKASLLSSIVTRTRRRDVQELKTIRRVEDVEVPLSAVERQFYDEITLEVKKYADEKDLNAKFLLSSPQRMLSSSLPATLNHWNKNIYNNGNFDEGEDIINDFDFEEEDKPLTSRLRSLSSNWDFQSLKKEDTKYSKLKEAIKKVKEQNINEKIVIFSTFISTLKYLSQRLVEDGYNPTIIHSQIKDRDLKLKEFKSEVHNDILLSSEVGSEGLDLQFCKTLFNYDLPWNPMRVEQRIGRVDRLGQKSEYVSIWNFVYGGTIDWIIYERLYKRLKLCEEALGGFEDILSNEMNTLENSLRFSFDLTPDEQQEMVEQTAIAIENKKINNEELEKESSGLMAYGDYVFEQISSAHKYNKWMNSNDLQSYLIGFFKTFYPSSRLIVGEDANDVCKLTLDSSIREDLKSFIQINKNIYFSPIYNTKESKVVFGKISDKNRINNIETINQLHSLIKFASDKINTSKKIDLRPAVICKLDISELEGHQNTKYIQKGLHLIFVSQWSIENKNNNFEKLAYSGINLDLKSKIDERTTELLVSKILDKGTPLEENMKSLFNNEELLNNLHKEMGYLASDLMDDYQNFCDDYERELFDKTNFQLQSLKEIKAKQLATKREVREKHILNKRFALQKASEAQIDKIIDKFEQKEKSIKSSRDLTNKIRDVAAIILHVD